MLSEMRQAGIKLKRYSVALLLLPRDASNFVGED